MLLLLVSSLEKSDSFQRNWRGPVAVLSQWTPEASIQSR